MIKEALKKVISGNDLNFKEAKTVFGEILKEKATDSQIASFLTALALKGEHESEIHGAAHVIRENALKLRVRSPRTSSRGALEAVVDTCGTGGSGVEKFNISSAVGFVVAASGLKVAKHGNRAMSSRTGSADLLEHLGINITLDPRIMEKAIKKVGIGFLYAPLYHPALKSVARIRREMNVRTIFNILGPLCNPAGANYQLLGVYRPGLTLTIARVLRSLGVVRAFVVSSQDLKDEVTLTGITRVSFVNKKRIENFTLSPRNFGLKKCSLADLEVTSTGESARLIQDILSGKSSPARDVVLANAACCFYITGKVRSLRRGAEFARYLIEKEKAKEKLREFKQFLQEHE